MPDRNTPQSGCVWYHPTICRSAGNSSRCRVIAAQVSWVNLKLETLGFQDSFEVVLGGDDVTRGKPEPDIYLLAADRLNIPPDQCIAIEDSPVGISAAVNAGIYTVAVLTDSTRGMDLSQAQLVLETLESFDLNLLRT